MAELILTKEEKAAATWLELDDATVGKVVKKLGTGILKMASEQERMFWYSAALMLCSTARDNDSESMTVNLEGFNDNGAELGDWRVTVQKLKADASPAANAEDRKDGWQPITAPGQVKAGTKLRFTIGENAYNETVKEVLYPGKPQEEIIYNLRRNYYLITSMAIANQGSQKNVKFFSTPAMSQDAKGEGE